MNKYSIFLVVSILTILAGCQPPDQPIEKGSPEVLIHYMSWYGDESAGEDSLRHWQFGHANNPIIGRYDSHEKPVLYYHLLLAWSAGIDGVVVNVKDDYDRLGMERLLEAIHDLDALSEKGFDFRFAISYDDQGFDLEAPLDTAILKLGQFKKAYVDKNSHYLKYNNKPVFYSFDYPKKYLTAAQLRYALDSIYKPNQSLLIWNTFGEGENTQDYVEAYYPWVQPGGSWEADGSNWGKGYLDYFYQQVNRFDNKDYPFIGGGVWPGFDDRKNTSWGGNRLISRSGGATYDSTWMYVQSYQGEIPMKYVMIETWNDWNEGTEIEPSIEHSYQNLVQTANQIRKLKGLKLAYDTNAYELAVDIYKLLNKHATDSLLSAEGMDEIIRLYLKRQFIEARAQLESIP